jgi:Mn2+/Fe2+ NRAMP family transporter
VGNASWLRALGPGLLFAAAAVGVSHLVQSTRAGAQYGLGMMGVVLLANLLKYPPFRFGPEYAAATGTSLLEGYRRRGPAAVWLYGALTLATMFTVQAAVTVVTAGLALAVFEFETSAAATSAVLLGVCAVLLAVGRFRWLDRVVKALVAVLTVSTVLATVLVLLRWPGAMPEPEPWTATDVFFAAALFGWMPSAIDISVWQSLWALERERDVQQRASVADALVDFHVGYIGTALLAVCFVVLGAGVMHGRGLEFADGAAPFAAQLIDLYAATLGDWTRPVIGLSALAVMFSTTLTVLDGFPRALETFVARLRAPESVVDVTASASGPRPVYWMAMSVIGLGAVLVIGALPGSLKGLVDIATTLSFLTAPVLAALNHAAILGHEVPAAHRPRPWLANLSRASIALQAIFALAYLYVRYG